VIRRRWGFQASRSHGVIFRTDDIIDIEADFVVLQPETRLHRVGFDVARHVDDCKPWLVIVAKRAARVRIEVIARGKARRGSEIGDPILADGHVEVEAQRTGEFGRVRERRVR
jgi:hypothetical protein